VEAGQFVSAVTPWSRVLPEKLPLPQLLKKFPAFYGTRRFIAAFIRARHLFIFWASLIPRLCEYFVIWLIFYGKDSVSPPKVEDHTLSAVRDCLFNVFAATLYFWRPFTVRNLRTRNAVETYHGMCQPFWPKRILPERWNCRLISGAHSVDVLSRLESNSETTNTYLCCRNLSFAHFEWYRNRNNQIQASIVLLVGSCLFVDHCVRTFLV
jgi:hypothetical protein